MRKKSRSKQANKIEFLEQQVNNNIMAIKEGPTKRKKWSIHDMVDVKALAPPQHEMVKSYIEGNNIVGHGSAGTGKTFLALFLAFNDILSKETRTDHVIIVRSIVPARDIGFLPGTEEEKMAPYEAPYMQLLHQLFNKSNTYENMKDVGIIEFVPTSFIRGLTWDNAVVIVDEVQNMTFEEINSVMTRLGDNSRIIIIGDYVQNDLYRNKYDSSGIERFLRIVTKMKNIELVKFTKNDIIRSDFVKDWICAVEDDGGT